MLIFTIVFASEHFINQALLLAKKLHLSPFIIGLIVVSVGTSMAELISSSYAFQVGHNDIAIANILGSNIANITLVLGLLAVYKTYKISKTDVNKNLPLFILCISASFGIIWINNFIISPVVGGLILVIYIITTVLLFMGDKKESITTRGNYNFLIFSASLLAIILSSKWAVDLLLLISNDYGISETLLGSFVLSIGTSLPELTTLFVALRMGQNELGLGNVIGSNLFNLNFIIGLSSFFYKINTAHFATEYVFLFLASILMIFLAFIGKKFMFSRLEGFILLFMYCIFIFINL